MYASEVVSNVAVTREGRTESLTACRHVEIALDVNGVVTVRSDSLVTCALRDFAAAAKRMRGEGVSVVVGTSCCVSGDRLERNCSTSAMVVAIARVPGIRVGPDMIQGAVQM